MRHAIHSAYATWTIRHGKGDCHYRVFFRFIHERLPNFQVLIWWNSLLRMIDLAMALLPRFM